MKTASNFRMLPLLVTTVACAGPQATGSDSGGTEDMRIGSVNEPDYAFSGILALSPWGDRIYVLQRSVPEVWWFGIQGTRRGTIGGRGEGPGKLVGPSHFGFKGDSLWVKDILLGRVTLFDPTSGAPRRTIAFATPTRSAGWAVLKPGTPLSDGTLLVEPGVPADALTSGRVGQVPLLKVDESGTVRDTLAWRNVRGEVMAIELRGNLSWSVRHPLPGSSLLAVDKLGDVIYLAEGTAAGSDPAFRLTAVSTSGDTLWAREYERPRVRVRPSDLDALADSAYEAMPSVHDRMSKSQFRDVYLQGVGALDFFPSIVRLVVSSEGTIWLRHEDGLGETAEWTAFDKRGNPTNRAVTPTVFTVHAITKTHMWGVERDGADIEYVVRRTY